uniref:aspartate-semialdehyde dehydrogenase n=1 Tax=Brassica oleracea var. oleracea TaxID=109376 RepID=A0A0D3DPA5_BRAOL
MATLTHHTPQTAFLSRLPLRPKPRAFSARVKMSLQESAPSLAVVGVTGAVGQEFLSVLSDRDFPYSSVKMLASKRSAGKRVAFDGREYTVEELTAESFDGVDIALFSAGGSISKEFGPRAAERGTIVVDNSSAFRMVEGVPLVIPEVNPEAMKGIKVGNGKGALIANPNCSTIICLMAVTPLHHHAKVKRMVVSTYQAASGAGAAAMEELVQQTREVLAGKPPTCNIFSQQYAFNLFSHNAPITENGYNEEEMKLVKETRKIWNDTEVKVTATCIRVPVMRAHAESVNLQFENPLDENTAMELLRKAPGVYIIDDRASNTFPTPLDVSNKDDVAVGWTYSFVEIKYAKELLLTLFKSLRCFSDFKSSLTWLLLILDMRSLCIRFESRTWSQFFVFGVSFVSLFDHFCYLSIMKLSLKAESSLILEPCQSPVRTGTGLVNGR